MLKRVSNVLTLRKISLSKEEHLHPIEKSIYCTLTTLDLSYSQNVEIVTYLLSLMDLPSLYLLSRCETQKLNLLLGS